MSRSYQGFVNPGSVADILEWDALAEPTLGPVPGTGAMPGSGARQPSDFGPAANAWSSSLVSVTLSYQFMKPDPAQPGTLVPANEPVMNADIRNVSVQVEFRSDLTCGASQTVECDLLQGATICVEAQRIIARVKYPTIQATPIPPIAGSDPVFPTLQVTAQLGRGTLRNTFVPRRTLAAPIVGGGLSIPQRVPPWASAVLLENALVGTPTAQIDFLTAFNGIIVQSALVGKNVPGGAVAVPNGAPYFRLVGALDGTARAVFLLQL